MTQWLCLSSRGSSHNKKLRQTNNKKANRQTNNSSCYLTCGWPLQCFSYLHHIDNYCFDSISFPFHLKYKHNIFQSNYQKTIIYRAETNNNYLNHYHLIQIKFKIYFSFSLAERQNYSLSCDCSWVKMADCFAHRRYSLRTCLHGGGGPQVTEVTHLAGVTRLTIYSKNPRIRT